MRYKITLLTVFIALLIAACSPSVTASQPVSTAPIPAERTQATTTAVSVPASFTITDQRGKEFTFAEPVQHIVSLAPANTEILFAVGAGKQVVGRDSFSDYPVEAKNVKDIGGGFGALDMEAILASNPELVLAGDLTPAEQLQALDDAGLSVFVLGNPGNLSGMYENLRIVARITGHMDEAETLIASLKERVTAVEQKLSGVTDRPLVMYELDGTDPNAPWVPGPGTFIDTLLTMAGTNNMSASLDGAWVQVSLETIIKNDPDIILLGDATWGGMTPEMVAARGGWDTLSAIQNEKVFPFDDNLVSRPGPRLVDGLEALARLLHPELFE
jgi:iron complex transport system substrate-binding protein